MLLTGSFLGDFRRGETDGFGAGENLGSCGGASGGFGAPGCSRRLQFLEQVGLGVMIRSASVEVSLLRTLGNGQ